jgi:hypothetical protein
MIEDHLQFEWLPGKGPEQSAIDSLRQHFGKRPSVPPGGAFSIDDEKRKYFTELLAQPMSDVSADIIVDCLYEMAVGLNMYPEEAPDWIEWFNYMLPFLVERGHERDIVEGAITTFIRMYGHSTNKEYFGFRNDALKSLGKVLMKPELWDEQGESIPALRQNWSIHPNRPKKNISCSGAISASIVFCLFYLPPESVAVWTRSLLRINSPYFRAHFLIWLLSTHVLLEGTTTLWLRSLTQAPYSIDWDNSYLLEDPNPKIPSDCMKQFLATIRVELSKELLTQWSTEISRTKDLAEMVKHFSIIEQVSDIVLTHK